MRIAALDYGSSAPPSVRLQCRERRARPVYIIIMEPDAMVSRPTFQLSKTRYEISFSDGQAYLA
jgi:hypothetical protein